MENSFESHVQHVFDSYCKRIIKNEAIDIQREYARFNRRQISLEAFLTDDAHEPYYYDDYSVDYELFLILGFEFLIKDEKIARAISELTESKRRIVLLFYFAGFNDREIAETLKMDAGTVWYQKKKVIEELRNKMEGQ